MNRSFKDAMSDGMLTTVIPMSVADWCKGEDFAEPNVTFRIAKSNPDGMELQDKIYNLIVMNYNNKDYILDGRVFEYWAQLEQNKPYLETFDIPTEEYNKMMPQVKQEVMNVIFTAIATQ